MVKPMISAMKVMMSVAIFAALSGCVVADVAGAGLSAGGAAVKTGVKVGGATAKAGAGVIGAATPKGSDDSETRSDETENGASSDENAPRR